MVEKNTERVNITMSKDVKQWFMGESEKSGISMAGLMALALNQYKQSQEMMMVMKGIGNMSELVDKMKEMITIENKK